MGLKKSITIYRSKKLSSFPTGLAIAAGADFKPCSCRSPAQKHNVIPNSSRAIPSFAIRSSPRRMPDDESNVSLAPAKFFLTARSVYSLVATVSEPIFTVLLVSNTFPLIEKYWSRGRGSYLGTNPKRIGDYWAGPPTVNFRERPRPREIASCVSPDARKFRSCAHRRMTNSVLSQYT